MGWGMSRKKSVAMLVALAICFPVSLLIEINCTDYDPLARQALASDPAVRSQFGTVEAALLVASRYRESVGSVKCSRLSFLVIGTAGMGFVGVVSAKPSLWKPWRVLDVVPGYWSMNGLRCRAPAA